MGNTSKDNVNYYQGCVFMREYLFIVDKNDNLERVFESTENDLAPKGVILFVNEKTTNNIKQYDVTIFNDNNKLMEQDTATIILEAAAIRLINDGYQRKEIKRTCPFLSNAEIGEIAARQNALIKCIEEKQGAPFFSDVRQQAATLISECSRISIEGFIRFRLKELMKKWYVLLDEVMDQYLIEREYQEFISLLQYFVEIQEARIDEVKLILGDKGQYELLDKGGNTIQDECIKEINVTSEHYDMTQDDILISTLITIAPRKITVQGCSINEKPKIIDTIGKVFRGKVVFEEK